MKLLRRECSSLPDDGLSISAIKIHALDRTVVPIRNAHIRPIEMPGLNINGHAIGDPAFAYQNFFIGAVGIDREDAALACLQKD